MNTAGRSLARRLRALRTRTIGAVRSQARRHTAAAAVAAAALAVAAASSGCAMRVAASPSIAVTSAYVPVPEPGTPGTTVAFLDIRNDGGPDTLVGARTSVGGTVVFRAPSAADATTMKTVPAISIPASATVRLLPNAAHLLITDAGPMHGGKDISLVLTFAHAGAVTVVAQVTDPRSGSASYFAN